MLDTGPLLLVGCGKMGGALAEGWLRQGLAAERLSIIEPEAAPHVQAIADRGAKIVHTASELGRAYAPETVVIAVKPQVMESALAPVARYVEDGALYVSIAAGKSTADLAATLGAQASVVRAMPNTPAAVGRGITVLLANRNTDAAQRDRAEALMAAVGEVGWVEDERLMDAVTAVSGSGPAYVFLLVEALAAAGIDAGLPADLAARLARATVSGAGVLLEQSTEDAATLRRNVTSPGGTTAAALDVLVASDGLAPLMRRAVVAATRRSRELSGP